jgi:hypothetical protein
MICFGRDDRVGEIANGAQYVQRSRIKIPTLTSQNQSEAEIELFPRDVRMGHPLVGERADSCRVVYESAAVAGVKSDVHGNHIPIVKIESV